MVSNASILNKDNKTEFIKQCLSIKDYTSLRETIYRTGLQVVNGLLSSDLVISTFYEIIKSNQNIANIICDVMTVLDIESQILEQTDSNCRENFINFLKQANNTIISDWLLKERFDYSTIAYSNVIQNEKSSSTKFIKLKTKLYYKQQKFNLFREESEGYSKLLTELCQDGRFDPQYMLNAIKSLIGCFNLDPNRVLDIILECFESRPYLEESFITLIKNFSNNPTTLNQILAFKFSFYNNSESNLEVSSALYIITASLLHHELIDLENLYGYLYPTDSTICELHQSEMTEAANFPKKISAILSVEGSKHDDINVFEDVKTRLINSNQKLGLILALINLGDWNLASKLMNKLPQYFAVSYPEISEALCSLLHYLIGPIYKKYSSLPNILASRIKLGNERTCVLQPIDNLDEFRTIVIPIIMAFGPYLYTDSLLMAKIIRILRTIISHSNYPEDFRYDVLNVLSGTILPSFSLFESNSALAEELWNLLILFPYNERFSLYSVWKHDPSNPLLIKMKAFTMRRIRYVMKRISKDKDSIKQSGRLIGKLSHSNPTFLFEYMLGQIQSYDNLIGPVVDSLKYLSSVSYDVLLFCVIETLSNPEKEHSKAEGTSLSPWLLSLASFCGAVTKKYTIELPGLLQFVANQLKLGKCLDLLILKEIVQKMTGIETSEEITNEQLEAMSGGELLRTEGGSFNQIRNIKKSTIRLKEALLENNLAMPLCVLMAQQRNCIVFQSKHTHPKLIGKLYDYCQETLVQYGNFLSNSLTIDDYKRRLPSLKELLIDYHLSPDVAFFLTRPMIRHDITSVFEEMTSNKSNKLSINDCYNKATEIVLGPMIESIKPELGTHFSIDLNPRFFVTFWTMTMYDLKVPENSYQRERNKIDQQIQMLEENKDVVLSKKRKEKERLLSISAKLHNERVQQSEHVSKVMNMLEHDKKYWFETSTTKIDVTTNFLQHCLIPRCKFTAFDALYCAEFVHLLHCIKTPNFSTLICFDRIFGDISYTMSSCTENEANHYGRFLCAILQIIMRWHKNIKLFEEECSTFPGFFTKSPVCIDYESYRHVCHKWHYRLTKAFILCLDSGDYIQIRNSLIVLTKLLPHFPVMIGFAQAIERRLDKIRNAEKEKRPDLFALATGYSGKLKSKKSTFIPEGEFHEKETKRIQSQPQQNTSEQTENENNENDNQKKDHRNSENTVEK